MNYFSRYIFTLLKVSFLFLNGNIYELNENEIQSGGYVIQTLEASIWCLLTTDTYEEADLQAVNLGGDTDTTGAVTGGLAGLFYGHAAITKSWIKHKQEKKKKKRSGAAVTAVSSKRESNQRTAALELRAVAYPPRPIKRV